VYNELLPKGELEVVFLSADEDDESFMGYLSKMPCPAVPFSDSEIRKCLDELFVVKGILLDENGKVLTDGGVETILEYGVEGYPLLPKWVKEIKDREEAAKRDQSLKSILLSQSRDFVFAADGRKVSSNCCTFWSSLHYVLYGLIRIVVTAVSL